LSLPVPAALAVSLCACNRTGGATHAGIVNTSTTGSYSGDSGRVVSIREVAIRHRRHSATRPLQRLLAGDLLPRHLPSAMLDQYPVSRPIAGRPWKTPAYGLGLMIGGTKSGELIAGHTGGGAGSGVAVYHRLDSPTGTAAAFEFGGNDEIVEGACATLLRRTS
jgi:hypothetical protein